VARGLLPPDEFLEIHEDMLSGLDHYSEAADLLVRSVDLATSNDFGQATSVLNEAISEMLLANANIRLANELLNLLRH